MTDTTNGVEVFAIPEGLELRYKQQAFIYEFLVDCNLKRVAADINIHVTTAQRWVGEPGVREAIAAGMLAKARRKQIDADWVLDKLVALYETSFDDFLVTPEYGAPYYDLSKATPEQRAAIESIALESTVGAYDAHNVHHVIKTKITLPSKIKLLELIGKHVDVQAFRERMDVTMHSVEERLIAGRKRARLTVIPGGKKDGTDG